MYGTATMRFMNGAATWIEISRSALAHNLGELRKLAGADVKLFPCVKANAYGHGLEVTGRLLAELGIEGFSVADMSDARALRNSGISLPIQVMTPLSTALAKEAAELQIWVWVHRLEEVKALTQELSLKGKKLSVVVKVDTGMHRLGAGFEEYELMIEEISRAKNLELISVATHYATADLQDELFFHQKEVFEKVKQTVEMKVKTPVIFQSANSAALASETISNEQVMRPGIAIYGYWPTEDINTAMEKRGLLLKPVLTWKAQIQLLKVVNEGEAIGYGGTFVAMEQSMIAIVPVGYAQGVNYRLSGKGMMQIEDKEVAMRGSISMNLTALDVTETKSIKVGDDVIVLNAACGANHWAELAGTIRYDILTGISSAIERRIVD